MIRCAILEKENTFLISLLESSTHFLYRERACEPVRLASGRLAGVSARRACPSSGNRVRDRKLTHLGVAAPDADDSGQGTALDPAWQGVFCVRLNVEPSAREMQPTAVCIDPGSKNDAGIGVFLPWRWASSGSTTNWGGWPLRRRNKDGKPKSCASSSASRKRARKRRRCGAHTASMPGAWRTRR